MSRGWEGRSFFAPAATLLRDALTQIDDPTAADRLAQTQALAVGRGISPRGE